MFRQWNHSHTLATGTVNEHAGVMDTPKTTVRVHPKVHRRLAVLARREGRPMSEIVRRAVNVYEGKPA